MTVILDSIGNLPDSDPGGPDGQNGYTGISVGLDYAWNLTPQATVNLAPGCDEFVSSVINFTTPSFSRLLDGVDAEDCFTLVQDKKGRVSPGE